MSYLDKPRVGFSGSDAMTNPSTANNENVIHLLDYDNVELLNPPLLQGAELKEMSDVAYREWMTTLMTYDAGNPADPAGQSDPGWAPAMPGYWNYYGDHLTTFGTAAVNGVWMPGDDAPRTTDPLVGARVAFDAKLVDVDPADTFSSQLISAAFSLVGPGAGADLVQLVAGIPTIAHLRWTNFNRPYGAGTFQCVIPNETLRWADDAPDSAGLEALRKGAAAGGGLMLRYCLYDMQAGIQMPEMYDRFQAGEYAWNPKVGFVLGTIGVWNGVDMTTAPVGRVMQPPSWPNVPPAPEKAAASATPHVAGHGDLERLHTPGTKDQELLASLPDQTKVGPAVAVVQGNMLVLDLLTTFPEQAPRNMAKVDYGEVTLWAGDTFVGVVPYDQATYESQAGVVELPLFGDDISGPLSLRDQYRQELLREIGFPLVETDDRGVYLDMDDEGGTPAARGTVRVRAFDKGEPAQAFALRVQVVADEMHLGVANSLEPFVVQQNMLHWKVLSETTVQVPDSGEVDVPFETTTAGCYKLRFLPEGMPVPAPDPNFAAEFYANVRVLPYHDYSGVPDEEITWDFVYREVFSYYGILYPIMSLIIPWGPDNLPNDPTRVAQFAAIMKQAVDRKYLGTALSMPITRELDEGKRRLVQRWCDLQLQQAQPS
ncbi:MAG TPA: hypothetical protein VF529_07995 [Solirubrobacteraceae bacterium]|jgi:hypothetical protein